MGYPQQPQYPPQYPPPQYPPQGYPPQYPPTPPATPDPWAQQAPQYPPQAAPAAPQYANQGQAIAAANPLADPLANAGVGDAPVYSGPLDANGNPIPNPTLRSLGAGRAVIIVPKQIRKGVENPWAKTDASKPATRNEMTCDLIVVDGPPFMYGGDPQKSIVDFIGPMQVPCVIPNMLITQDGIIERVPEDRVGRGIVVARLVKGTTSKGNHPWNASEVPVDEYAPLNLRAIYQAYTADQLPRPTVGVPRQQSNGQAPPPPAYASPNQPAATQYAPPAAPQYPQPGYNAPQVAQYMQQMQPQGAPQNGVPTWPQMQPGQHMAPMGQPQGNPYAQPDPAQQAMAQGAPAQPASAPQPPVQDWTAQQPAPAGYEPMWSGMTPAAREQILRAMGVVGPNASGFNGVNAAGQPSADPSSPYARPPGY